MPLPLRKIGSGSVPPIGFGAMGISAFYGAVDSDEERFKVTNKPTSSPNVRPIFPFITSNFIGLRRCV